MSDRPAILILERDRIAAQALERPLIASGLSVHHAESRGAAIELLQQKRSSYSSDRIGVALIDQDSAGLNLETLKQLHADWPPIVPIVTSAFPKVESAAMRLGAADYLLKPIIEKELLDAVQRAMQRHLLMVERELAQIEVAKPRENVSSVDEVDAPYAGGPLSEAMKTPERRILLAALEANGWNRGETAKQLDINRTTLYKKIRQHRLDEPA